MGRQEYRNAGRLEALDFIAEEIASGDSKFQPSDVFMFVRFSFAFNWKTGRQNKALSQSALANQAGVSEDTAKRFLRRMRQGGILSVCGWRQLSVGQRATPMYQLRVPNRTWAPRSVPGEPEAVEGAAERFLALVGLADTEEPVSEADEERLCAALSDRCGGEEDEPREKVRALSRHLCGDRARFNAAVKAMAERAEESGELESVFGAGVVAVNKPG